MDVDFDPDSFVTVAFFLITFNTIASRLQYFFFFFLNNPLKTWADTNLNV